MVAARTGKEIRVGSDLHLVSWFRSSRDQISRSPGESRDPPQPWTPAFAGNAGEKGASLRSNEFLDQDTSGEDSRGAPDQIGRKNDPADIASRCRPLGPMVDRKSVV